MSDTNSAIAENKSAAASAAVPPESQTDVYAIQGADPEVLAYAMAKYSRSSLSMKESLAEISSQRAEQFLNTFYFQYGHRSIADLAHIPFAIERLSLLPPSPWLTSSAGMARNAAPATRTSANLAGTRPSSAARIQPSKPPVTPRLSKPSSPPTTASAQACWRPSKPPSRSPRP